MPEFNLSNLTLNIFKIFDFYVRIRNLKEICENFGVGNRRIGYINAIKLNAKQFSFNL